MIWNIARALACGAALAATARAVPAQDSTVTLARARESARATSPEIAAARHALQAARGRARQAGAFVNPVLTYSREQTGASGSTTSQNIAAVDQVLEAPGVRSARRDATRLRAEAADARLRAVEVQVDFEVTRAFAEALAADRRVALAAQAAQAFAAAVVISERRLAEGDISGFAARRIRLEAARYATLAAEAWLTRHTARLALATLTEARIDSTTVLADPGDSALVLAALDEAALLERAAPTRPDLQSAQLELDAAAAEARLAARERLPSATVTLGSKSEETLAGDRLTGLVAGIALPLPLWDRRAGAVSAGHAETRRRAAELDAARRRVAREVREAAAALRAARDQLRALGPTVQADAAAALRSAQVAYAEGELTLLEWLDTVRAYFETETTFATLRSALLVRAATLERAVGAPVIQELR